MRRARVSPKCPQHESININNSLILDIHIYKFLHYVYFVIVCNRFGIESARISDGEKAGVARERVDDLNALGMSGGASTDAAHTTT